MTVLRLLLRRSNHHFTTTLRLLSTTTTLFFHPTTRFISSPNQALINSLFNSRSFSAAAVSFFPSKHEKENTEMNEFLSRFVHSMRSKLTDAYPNSDKPTIDKMLLIVVDKLIKSMDENGGTFDGLSPETTANDDLTITMWEVSNTVFEEMEKEKKKEKLNKYLQSETVKELARFASEVGVRGDMLREMRFKFAREEMEKAEFYEGLDKLRTREPETENEDENENESVTEGNVVSDTSGLPKRRGVINYKLYGLDLSGEKWREVAEKVNEVEELVWPSEAKEITGKCKVVMEKIVGLGFDEELINEWVELLEPSKVDWVALLDNVKASDYSVYLKMTERVLDEPTFQADIRDYSLLIDAHAKANRTEDVERLLKKMSEKGLPPDVLILISLLHMYSKANNLDQAKEAYEALRKQGFKPDDKIYSSMIMAYVNAGQPKLAESLMREMEIRDIKPSEAIYISLLQSFADQGDISGAQRIVTTMQFAGFQPTADSCTSLIQASAKSGNSTAARNNFDNMMKLGYKPDDRSTSMVVSAYEKKNELDKALSLLLQLEKDGFEPGISTYCVLVDWLSKLQLVDEAEHILSKIAQLGEAPPFKLQVSLCDMYAKSGIEKKALQALGVLEAKKDQLESGDFDRIIGSLLKGGFEDDARRIQKLMEAQGLTPSEKVRMSLLATESFRGSGANKQRKG